MEFKKNILNFVGETAKKSAERGMKKTCIGFCYQPAAPMKKNLKQNNG